MLAYVNLNYSIAGSLEYEQELNSLLLNYVQTRAPFVAKALSRSHDRCSPSQVLPGIQRPRRL